MCVSEGLGAGRWRRRWRWRQYSLVLHHVHDDPVRGVDVLPDEVFEHDERFHEEILEEEQRGKGL